MKKIFILQHITLITLFFTSQTAIFSQTPVTRIYTDHNGYFTSSTGSIQSPDVASHNLLAFQTGGTVWSTGANNGILTSNAVTFIPLNFNAMPATVSGGSSTALIGLGRQHGGYVGSNGCNPAVSIPYGTNLSSYLTDGANGLDLSTAIFNIGGNIIYTIAQIDPVSIGDGVPDILVTQTGDINNTSWDKFRFLNASNALVGAEVDVNFSTVSTVARPYWKFYSLSGVCGESSSGTRDLRILAFDFADLGVTTSNYTSVVKFQHVMTPNSDVAFIAYNTISAVILPITLLEFNAAPKDKEVHINWTTATEINNDYFTVERSQDGQNWEPILRRDAIGDSKVEQYYEEVDNYPLAGVSYYRLRQTDYDGATTLSNVVSVNRGSETPVIQIYPNPADNLLSISGEKIDNLIIVDLLGKNVMDQISYINNSESVIQFDIQQLNSGYYMVQCNGEVYPFVVK